MVFLSHDSTVLLDSRYPREKKCQFAQVRNIKILISNFASTQKVLNYVFGRKLFFFTLDLLAKKAYIFT